MMNDSDSNMAANAVCFAADAVKHEYFYTLAQHARPSAVYKPAIYPDGNMWCALLGTDLQNGVAGFGKTPALAMEDFDKNFNGQTLKSNEEKAMACIKAFEPLANIERKRKKESST